jgi:hypothetical protein
MLACSARHIDMPRACIHCRCVLLLPLPLLLLLLPPMLILTAAHARQGPADCEVV